ncbi:hypothetical protein RQN9TF_12550 [Rhodococcus qingshengii]|uniref:hypothetical protein n=1 Tax=Rhodococcus TaxID=1827 RepID=UPI000F61807B|nr:MULTISPECIES: hypothetical protein [Rhodococcus]AZI61823.1 hypothetical protein EHW12_12090 [Rhodococcus sp. NJ-530]BDQ20034.1 hypothetical protein RQN9TF_12550 [Rhodococcus qingshengii]
MKNITENNTAIAELSTEQLAGLQLVHRKTQSDNMSWYYQLAGDAGEYDKVKVELFYSLGGTNYFTGGVNRRGYYVSLRLVALNGFVESYEMFDQRSGKVFLEPAQRFSQARLLTLQDRALKEVEPYVVTVLSAEAIAA